MCPWIFAALFKWISFMHIKQIKHKQTEDNSHQNQNKLNYV